MATVGVKGLESHPSAATAAAGGAVDRGHDV